MKSPIKTILFVPVAVLASLAITSCSAEHSALAQEAAPSAAGFIAVSGCRPADYVPAQSAAVTIQTTQSFTFTPKCLTVPAGTSVTIVGSSMHPVQGMDSINSVVNPFQANNPARGAITKILTQPGFYGYFCVNHGQPDGSGMTGSILVQ